MHLICGDKHVTLLLNMLHPNKSRCMLQICVLTWIKCHKIVLVHHIQNIMSYYMISYFIPVSHTEQNQNISSSVTGCIFNDSVIFPIINTHIVTTYIYARQLIPNMLLVQYNVTFHATFHKNIFLLSYITLWKSVIS